MPSASPLAPQLLVEEPCFSLPCCPQLGGLLMGENGKTQAGRWQKPSPLNQGLSAAVATQPPH